MAKKRRKAAKRKLKSSASRRARPKARRKKTKVLAKRASRRKAAVKKSKPRAKVKRAKAVSHKAAPSVVVPKPSAKREELPEDITLSEEMGEDVREEIALDDEEDDAGYLEKSEDVVDDNDEYHKP